MKKIPLIGMSIIAVVLLVLGSLTNVVGYQTIQTSHLQTVTEEVNQRDLLFQTIVDITNNKEIQQQIFKSQIRRGSFLTAEVPFITKNQVRQMYFIGLVLSKVISKARIQSMIQQYQLISPEIQQKINAVLQKNTILYAEILQLKNSKCDCKNENLNETWHFPIICWLLFPFMALAMFLVAISLILLHPFYIIVSIIQNIGIFIGTIAYNLMAILQCQYTSVREGNL